MATSRAARALLLLLLLLFCLPGLRLGARGGGQRPRGCPAPCRCEQEGMLVRADCSDLGLTAVPANLSVFTSYLDLSMNNITKLPSNPVHNLRFLEELRLAGNGLTYIPKGAFAGLFSLKVLMLQNNQLRQVPTEALQNLHSLQSLISADQLARSGMVKYLLLFTWNFPPHLMSPKCGIRRKWKQLFLIDVHQIL